MLRSLVGSEMCIRDRLSHMGIAVIIQSDLIDGVIENSANLAGIVMSGVAGYISIDVMDVHVSHFWNILVIMIVGYLVGYALMCSCAVTLEAAMVTLLLCFEDNPELFEETHPCVFGKLVCSWAESDVGVPDWVQEAAARIQGGQPQTECLEKF
eukprot:TRINITY_DN22038_c0_g1_i2.p2 TRINITY_DN22038_c0_g1~~TRINITY_DN22038_c0_g1_i2.p2  ORF type:complete len:154 (-),score=49.12 TRINITY_DN22038_c0_g1_i2:530-991(-)